MALSGNKKIFIILLIFIVLILIVFFLLPGPIPDPEQAAPEQISEFIAGKTFVHMPEEKRHEFMKQIKQRGIPLHNLIPQKPEMRENFFRNMEFFKQERLKVFFDMPQDKQKEMLKEALRDRRMIENMFQPLDRPNNSLPQEGIQGNVNPRGLDGPDAGGKDGSNSEGQSLPPKRMVPGFPLGKMKKSHKKALEGQTPEDRARTVIFEKKLKNYEQSERKVHAGLPE